MSVTTATATKSQFSLSLFKKLEKSGNGWKALCPAHDDRNPSLSITESADSWALHCHAGCRAEEVCAAVGLTLRDLFKTTRVEPREVAHYDYTDENGRLLFQTVRLEPKDFWQRRPNGNGGWIWKLGETRRVLYHCLKYWLRMTY